MASTFAGLVTSTNGLTASKAGLTVTSNNISNVNTTGYSRQVLIQSAIGPAAVYNRSAVGVGASVDSVTRVSDSLLDKKYWTENATLGATTVSVSYLEELEAVMGDADDTFSSLMNDFYEALEDVSTDSGSSETRTALQTAGEAICDYLNEISKGLSQLQSDVNTEVKTTATQINSYASQIAALNDQISKAQTSGASTNELEDSRDALLDKLSSLADITVGEVVVGTNADGSDRTKLTVSINGVNLVYGDDVNELTCDDTDGDGLYDVGWSNGAKFSVDDGELATYLSLRDGSSSTDKGIPYYTNKLDEFAQTFAKAFNEGVFADGETYYAGHAGGYDADGDTGVRFFSYNGLSSEELASLISTSGVDAVYANITAANISLSSDVQDDVNKIAAASEGGEESNNENVDALLDLCKDSRMFSTGTAEDAMASIVAILGSQSESAQNKSDRQSTIVDFLTASRSSVSGVSTNEETINMTTYQEAYEASASLVSMWNEVYATTINMVNDD
ncbi:hypothetical protein P22_2359 [Propionispora sp. 2/2-37]|uniref:flagellar hook-associated protein FlgK n=1 Tax=Propionispora sp. 2/2-37 TaxID=1677858 RepID=UPI0006BB8EA3|nr:flagellar hook-associated protein FlgK [Propionispora sp. 2/2-37]CUH96269.1 hypothetical protein P22_2359 [Propionispora sp. 2/2-37]